MSFLSNNNSEFLSARITQKGRNSIAKGNFVISYFQIGDSEFDYTPPFTGLTGSLGNEHQMIFAPLNYDKKTNGGTKYPYKMDTTDGATTYGIPVEQSSVNTIRNIMGPAGFVTNYKPYSTEACTGTTIECLTQTISLSGVSGTNQIIVLSGSPYNQCGYVTLVFNQFVGTDPLHPIITGNSNSLVYKIVGISGNTLTLDRNTPDLSACSGSAEVICNNCENEYPISSEVNPTCNPILIDTNGQLNPWTLDIVWGDKPIGFDTGGLDESLTGFEGNKYISTKQFLGYTTTSGQTFTDLTGNTITGFTTSDIGTSYLNSFGETIPVKPEEQRTIAIIHYSKLGDLRNDPERFYKYDDYISTDNTSGNELLVDENDIPLTDLEYFEVYIPFINYHRNTGTTIGAMFKMDLVDYYVNSKINAIQQIKFRYLLDEQGYRVGKIFVNNKVIVFDDQEIVAVLDYKSNRKYTLPAPKINLIPTDKGPSDSLYSGSSSGVTWVTYMFNYTGDTQLNGLPCNYFTKFQTLPTDTWFTIPANLSVKFSGNSFSNLYTGSTCNNVTKGFMANQFQILIQHKDVGVPPAHDGWICIDYTPYIPGHTLGNLIDPSEIINKTLTITLEMYTGGTTYDIETYLGTVPKEPSSLPEFGDEQPFPGSVRLLRATDIEMMNFLVNLPETQFKDSQNPTWDVSTSTYVTEVVLLNSNKEALVIAKPAKPVKRTGTQVFSVKLDF